MIIVADENIPLLNEFFADFGEISSKPGRQMTNDDVKSADALLVRSVTSVNETLLASSKVNFVASATIGTDHIDQEYLSSRNIGFANAPGCNAESVADYVISALLNLAELKHEDLSSKLVGVIGVGNVGSAVVSRLRSYGCEVICNDPLRVANEGSMDNFVELTELLTKADVVCMHAPLTHTGSHPSYHLVGDDQLNCLKAGDWLLNAGRGAVIDNKALKSFLKAQPDHIEVVLDVWEPEPNFDTELLELVRWGTPHIAGYSIEGRMRGTEMVYQAFCQHFGLPIEKKLEEFLPKSPELRAGHQSNQNPDQKTLQNRMLSLVNQCYDLREDDARLRQSLTIEPNQVGTYFDKLRRTYPMRRQLSTSNITIDRAANGQGNLQDRLKSLGFYIKE